MSRTLNWLSLILVIVGGLNWGLVGLFGFNLVDALFGAVPVIERTVYTLVGIAAAYMVYYAVVVEGKEHGKHETTHAAH